MITVREQTSATFRRAGGLNTAYVIVEGAAGWTAGSFALLANAAHNLTDVAGLPIAINTVCFSPLTSKSDSRD